MSLDIKPILESIGEDIIAEMQSNLKKNKPGKKWNSMASENLYGSFQTEIKKDVLDLAVTPTPQGLQSMRGGAETSVTSLENGRRIDTFYWQK